VIGLTGLVVGPLLALVSSVASAVVAVGLVAAILGYDLGLRRTVMGPQVMGICRGLNLLMGLARAPLLSGPAGWIAAVSVSVFVCGFTWISRWETETGRLEGLTAGIILENVALAGLLAVALRLWPFPAHSASGDRVLPVEGLLILLLVGLFVNQANSKAVKEPTPARMQGAVKSGILSLSWIDAGLVASVVGLVPSLAIVLLWLPAPFLAKRIYST
jgi:4-hydroxybenzoate polyprenyltransferase